MNQSVTISTPEPVFPGDYLTDGLVNNRACVRIAGFAQRAGMLSGNVTGRQGIEPLHKQHSLPLTILSFICFMFYLLDFSSSDQPVWWYHENTVYRLP